MCGKSGPFLWKIRAFLRKIRALLWKIRAHVRKIRAFLWKIRAFLRKIRAGLWKIRAACAENPRCVVWKLRALWWKFWAGAWVSFVLVRDIQVALCDIRAPWKFLGLSLSTVQLTTHFLSSAPSNICRTQVISKRTEPKLALYLCTITWLGRVPGGLCVKLHQDTFARQHKRANERSVPGSVPCFEGAGRLEEGRGGSWVSPRHQATLNVFR